jgi:competence protein ComEA
MSFYRTILAAVAAAAIASPVFADDTTMGPATTDNSAPVATQSADQAPATTDATTTATAEQTKVDLNKATAKELMKVKGLNAAKARAIVAYRKKHGDFKSTDDLSNVKGFKRIKPELLKEIQDQLSV